MQQITVLIVDDSSVMRKIVGRAVKQAGLENALIIEADNGSEALEQVRRQRVDLILTDINMPVMDGFSFLRQMREQELAAGIPVVVISIEGSEQHVRQAIAVGARAYIRKPFTPEQVRDRVLPLLMA
ncbi:MAG: response regulator [Acidobacteriaceae bacterium]